MIEYVTETARLEERILAALRTIRDEWGHMLPTTAPAVRLGGGSRSVGITGDNSPPRRRADGTPYWPADHRDVNDVDSTTGLVSLRREAIDLLNSWSRVVIEERPVTKAIPDGLSAVSMTRFLDRHARWMSGHDTAPDMADELEIMARKVLAVTKPQGREWISLGSCPEEIEVLDDAGSLVMAVCNGQVRAWPKITDDDGEVMARCRRCGTEAVTAWWERRMFADEDLKVTLTDEEVVLFVHRAYGKVIKQSTVRQWVKRKIIAPSGTIDGKRVFDRHALVWALDKEAMREAMGL